MTGLAIDGGGLPPERVAAILAARAAALRARAAAVAAPEPAEETAGVLLVQIGADAYAVPVDQTAAVVPVPARVARLPGARAGVLGVFARSGGVVTLLDPATALGSAGDRPAAHALVVRRKGAVVALAIGACTGTGEVGVAAAAPAAAGALTRLAPLRGGGHVALVDLEGLIERLLGG